jgi:uncharacterized protein YbjT (DUF2867 family)
MFLVIGGRSKIGSALIDELLERGQRVRALARGGEAGSFPPAVEVVSGDLGDSESVAAAMRDVEKVFLACGPRRDEVQLNKNAIDVAEAGDVNLLVRSSIMGADPASPSTFMRDHGICDEYLRAADVEHAIVRPNMFMENIPETTIPSIDANGTFYANAGDARVSMVDTRDVAAVGAVLLTDSGHRAEALEVTGPVALSYDDVAAILSRALGRQTTYVEVPDDAVRQTLAGFGLDPWMSESLVELFQDYRGSGVDGYASVVTDTVQRLTGRPARTLEAMLEERGPVGSAPAG